MAVGSDRAADRSASSALADRARNGEKGVRQRGRADFDPIDEPELAASGWLVEVCLTIDEGPGFRFFAVGMAGAEQAEEAVLRFPGIFRDDIRTARRPLSSQEIAREQLRTHGVRPYRMRRQRLRS